MWKTKGGPWHEAIAARGRWLLDGKEKYAHTFRHSHKTVRSAGRISAEPAETVVGEKRRRRLFLNAVFRAYGSGCVHHICIR